MDNETKTFFMCFFISEGLHYTKLNTTLLCMIYYYLTINEEIKFSVMLVVNILRFELPIHDPHLLFSGAEGRERGEELPCGSFCRAWHIL